MSSFRPYHSACAFLHCEFLSLIKTSFFYFFLFFFLLDQTLFDQPSPLSFHNPPHHAGTGTSGACQHALATERLRELPAPEDRLARTY